MVLSLDQWAKFMIKIKINLRLHFFSYFNIHTTWLPISTLTPATSSEFLLAFNDINYFDSLLTELVLSLHQAPEKGLALTRAYKHKNYSSRFSC